MKHCSFSQLLAAHQQELDDLEENLGKQQNRQRAALREKMAARRKRKAALLRHRQEIEKQREQVEQRKEMAQVQVKTVGCRFHVFFYERTFFMIFIMFL